MHQIAWGAWAPARNKVHIIQQEPTLQCYSLVQAICISMLKKSLLKIAPSPSLAKAIRRTGTVWTRIHLAQVNWSPQKNQWLSFGKFSLGPPQPLRSFAVPPAVKNSKMIDWYGTIETTDQHKWHDPHFIQLPSWNHEMWNFIISNYASQYS